MGFYTDLTTNSAAIGTSAPRAGIDRASASQLLQKAAQHDPDVPASLASRDEVTVIPEQTSAGVADTYTLTFTFPNLSQADITTGSIAYDAVDTVIEAAIDTAFAAFPSWTNADISVAMSGAAGLDDGTVTLTFDGVSVASTPSIVSMTPTGWTQDGVITRTGGQGDRKALAALLALNVLSGTVHDIGGTVSFTRPDSVGQSRPRTGLIYDLAIVTVVEEGSDDVFNTLAPLYPQIAKI